MDVGSGSGYEEVFRHEYASILRTAFLITGDVESARDVTQDAFADLFARWRRIQRYDRPGAWVRMVAVQRAVKAARQAGRDEELSETEADPGPDLALRLDLLSALSRLSVMQRAAVVLHHFEDRPVKEAAKLMGCKPATASVHLHRARAHLAEKLNEEAASDAS